MKWPYFEGIPCYKKKRLSRGAETSYCFGKLVLGLMIA
jgi:hypothetical protein